MKLVIVAVQDRALAAFNRPFFVPTRGAAIRAFSDEINKTDSPMHAHPDDFDLYELGNWDDETGKFDNSTPPQQIAIGKNLIVIAQRQKTDNDEYESHGRK